MHTTWKSQATLLKYTFHNYIIECETVCIFVGHIPLYEPASDSYLLLWNYDEVLTVFHLHSCVIAYLSGHYHEGGYAVDEHGIHYASLRGIIEADATEDASATAHVYNGHIELFNVGSRKNPIDKIIIELKR